MEKIISNSEQETIDIGKKIAEQLKKGDVLCLAGDLGAGKTTLTKSIAKHLDIKDYVTSPTFTIINEYQGRLPIYHFDVYRIENIEDMYEIGYEDYFYGEGICIVEWANLIEPLLPTESIWIKIEHGKNENERIMTIDGLKI